MRCLLLHSILPAFPNHPQNNYWLVNITPLWGLQSLVCICTSVTSASCMSLFCMTAGLLTLTVSSLSRPRLTNSTSLSKYQLLWPSYIYIYTRPLPFPETSTFFPRIVQLFTLHHPPPTTRVLHLLCSRKSYSSWRV